MKATLAERQDRQLNLIAEDKNTMACAIMLSINLLLYEKSESSYSIKRAKRTVRENIKHYTNQTSLEGENEKFELETYLLRGNRVDFKLSLVFWAFKLGSFSINVKHDWCNMVPV